MARITIADCLEHVDNRFNLVLIASKRARQLSKNGALSRVPIENDKPTVLALREIAAGYVDFREEVTETVETIHHHDTPTSQETEF